MSRFEHGDSFPAHDELICAGYTGNPGANDADIGGDIVV